MRLHAPQKCDNRKTLVYAFQSIIAFLSAYVCGDVTLELPVIYLFQRNIRACLVEHSDDSSQLLSDKAHRVMPLDHLIIPEIGFSLVCM